MAHADLIDTAIVLAAGEGRRLRSVAPIKPLCIVGGKALLDHALTGLAAAGLRRAVVVLGYQAEPIRAHLASQSWPLRVETVANQDYHRPNGVSVLAARHRLEGSSALLAMGDHLVDPDLYRLMAGQRSVTGVRLAIDRRIDNGGVDLADVTRVRTQAGLIIAIGKLIPDFDCFDTGVFAVGDLFFGALLALKSPSVTQGVRALIPRRLALAVDCEGRDWTDVDDGVALLAAERSLTSRAANTANAGAPRGTHHRATS